MKYSRWYLTFISTKWAYFNQSFPLQNVNNMTFAYITSIYEKILGHKGTWVLFGFLFHVPQLLSINFTQQKLVLYQTNLWWNICKNRIDNQTSLALVTIIGTACLFILNWIYRSSQLCWLLNVEKLFNIWRRSPISFKTCVFMMFALSSSPNHVQIKYWGPIFKKNDRITLTYLNQSRS